jgi:aspartokinase-like uncharacterized kinase
MLWGDALLVVKLGGSLLGTPELQAWLDMLATQSDGRVIIVPGGGVFADAVREAQKTGGFDDIIAHHAALLAMDQYGLVLQALQPALATAASELEISERSWQHRAIVWLPSRMALADNDIPKNWEVTSDSLAAWLAAKIGADGLVLVKHPDVVASSLSLQQLMREGLLDPAFDRFASRLGCPVRVVGKQGYNAFSAKLLADPQPARAF